MMNNEKKERQVTISVREYRNLLEQNIRVNAVIEYVRSSNRDYLEKEIISILLGRVTLPQAQTNEGTLHDTYDSIEKP